jgi:serpin B
MRKLWTVTASAASLVFALTMWACAQQPPPLPYAHAIQNGGKIPFGTERQSVMLAGNRLGLELIAKLSADHPADNIVLSPLELTKMLGMLAEGTEGPTQSEVHRALGEDAGHPIDTTAAAAATSLMLQRIHQISRDGVEVVGDLVSLHISEIALVSQTFEIEPAFTAAIRTNFGASVERVDFTSSDASARIDEWIGRSSEGRINHGSVKLDGDTLAVILSALSFNGTWQTPFPNEQTAPQPFHLADGSTVVSPRMVQTGKYSYAENEKVQAVRLDYRISNFGLIVILPKPDHDAQTLLTDKAIADLINTAPWTSSGPWQETPGTVELPRFSTRSTVHLLPALRQAGYGINPSKTDYRRIGIPPDPEKPFIGVTDINQQIALDVDEEGTKAQVITEMDLGMLAGSAPFFRQPQAPFHMIVDRPFLIALTDTNTRSALVMGLIATPIKRTP